MEMKPIAFVRSCFKNKFGIPRQSRLAPSAQAVLVFEPEFSHPDAFEGLEKIKHLWLITQFHLNEGWSNKVRPPRLGGNKTMGVFATRAPFRPNPIGLSLVEVESFEHVNGQMHLTIKNHDLAEETPILDIKPYHYQLESLPEEEHWFSKPWKNDYKVEIDKDVIAILEQKGKLNLVPLLEETLRLDPRPQYKKSDDSKHYFVDYDDFTFEWIVEEDLIKVIQLK
jgi:tRNA-Thr(GGU) m(6)t(6)A37 methyltransferase TsaA